MESQSNYVKKLIEFHRKYDHTICYHPTILDVRFEVRDLRVKLMREELDEVIKAIDTENLIELADGLADLLYVVFGTAVTFGIPIDKVFDEVHRSNMTKSMLKDEKSIKGKTLKGPDWSPPRIHQIIFGDEPRTAKGSLD